MIGLGLSLLNFSLLSFLNIFYLSKVFFYDSLVNINFLNYCFHLNLKILIGKRFNQKSLFKKTIYLNYIILIKKYIFLSKLKCGDINYFSRINNEVFFLKSFKIFFIVLTCFTSAISSLNFLNFFLTYRSNFSNIIYIIYLNNLNINKKSYCFLNKTLIYYMVNNNIFYLFYNSNIKFNFICFSEICDFYSEHLFVFDFFDIFLLNIIDNFLIFKNPKYMILNNFINYLSILNFIIFF